MTDRISEESLNHFLANARLEATQPIKMYGGDRIQIWLENGAFLSIGINTYGDELDIDLLGPSPPDCPLSRREHEHESG